MSKGGRTQKLTTTATSAPDAASAPYIQQMRQFAMNAAGGMPAGSLFTGGITPEQISAAMSPFMGNVISGVRGEFDQMRQGAQMATDQAATQAGAFGGSRHAIAQGARLGELDRAQASQIANLLQSGYGQAVNLAQHNQALEQQKLMEPIFRAQTGLGFLNAGMGPVGMNSTSVQTQPTNKNVMGSALGGASVGAAFGPWGALAGGGLGLLGGLLG